jgi:class 3 adenylate cyclase
MTSEHENGPNRFDLTTAQFDYLSTRFPEEEWLNSISDEDLRRPRNEVKMKLLRDRCTAFLQSLKGKTIRVTVLNVDIVNSTKSVKSLSSESVGQYYEAFIESTSNTINRFGGYVLKNAGDCVIGIFPCSKYFVENHDKAMSCGLEIKGMITSSLNKYMMDRELPSIACRISADFGYANIIVIGLNGGYAAVDLFGNTMNSVAHISRIAKQNQMVIGENLLRQMLDTDDFDFKQVRRFILAPKHDYPVYLVERGRRKGGDTDE